jgi:hypothetical protein
MILFQFIDPGNLGPYANSGILIAVYFLLERRIRRIEARLNKLVGFVEGENK